MGEIEPRIIGLPHTVEDRCALSHHHQTRILRSPCFHGTSHYNVSLHLGYEAFPDPSQYDVLRHGIFAGEQVAPHHRQSMDGHRRVCGKRHPHTFSSPAAHGGQSVLYRRIGGEEEHIVPHRCARSIDYGDYLARKALPSLVAHAASIGCEHIVATVQGRGQGQRSPTRSVGERHHSLRLHRSGVSQFHIGHSIPTRRVPTGRK